jgi:hypothetical protein
MKVLFKKVQKIQNKKIRLRRSVWARIKEIQGNFLTAEIDLVSNVIIKKRNIPIPETKKLTDYFSINEMI